MSTSEAEVTPEVITYARSRYGATLLRNNSGAGFIGKKKGGPATNWVRWGLGQISDKTPFKSSDYIGVTPVLITQDMVGKTLAVMTCVEVKKSDWTYNEWDEREVLQKRFIEWMKSLGAFAGFAKSTACLKDIFKLP